MVYNKTIERRKKVMNTLHDLLEIAKDLLEIIVLILTAGKLIKKRKSKKSKKKK